MGNWKHDRAKKQIEARCDEVKEVEVVDYTRDTSLSSIPSNKAYRMRAVHLYADILNLYDMLNCTETEGETCHKRTLKFLNLHYRAAHRILAECEAIRVDFHNQRLHAVIAKPYGDNNEKARVERAVAIAQLLTDVLAETGDDNDKIPNAVVRIGIDTGSALAVNNGRRGNREPLFLGKPANHAAKLASNGVENGIYLTNETRAAIDLEDVEDEAATPLTSDEIKACESSAQLPITKDTVVRKWREDNVANPIGAFEFSRHTPPLRTLDITALTPANSRRMEAISVYADIDGFTAYVDKHIHDKPENVVRCLHVVRSELDRVLSTDFDGRRIRFIGDSVHGLIMEGTAYSTDAEASVSTAVLCAGGLRSSFELSLQVLASRGVDTGGIGLAVGLEYGPMTVTRLGMQGDRVRCSVSRGVLTSEYEQKQCDGTETGIGPESYENGTEAVKTLFAKDRRCANLTYDVAVEAMSAEGDKIAKKAAAEAYAVSSPALLKSADQQFRPHAKVS